jgi:hypothetical protein
MMRSKEPKQLLSLIDQYLTLWIIPCHGSRYRNRVLLIRSTDDDHKLSDGEFLDPNRDRSHPYDVSSVAIQKIWNMVW